MPRTCQSVFLAISVHKLLIGDGLDIDGSIYFLIHTVHSCVSLMDKNDIYEMSSLTPPDLYRKGMSIFRSMTLLNILTLVCFVLAQLNCPFPIYYRLYRYVCCADTIHWLTTRATRCDQELVAVKVKENTQGNSALLLVKCACRRRFV